MKEQFNTIRRVSLYEEIANILKEAILSKRYKKGESLPSEGKLSEQFGVSRNVIRESIRLLQSRGFLEVRRGKNGGIFIKELDATNIVESLTDLITLGNINLDQLIYARSYLEPEVTRLATQNATAEELQAIEEILQNYDMSSDDTERVALNCEFHRKIGNTCGNLIYSIIITTIMDYNERFIITLNPFRKVIHRQWDHRKIFDAIKDRNPEKAIILSQEHCQHLMEDMKKYEKTYLALVNK